VSESKPFGIEIVDVRIKRVDFVPDVTAVRLQPHELRAQAGGQQAAFRRRGDQGADPRRCRQAGVGDHRRGHAGSPEDQGRSRRQATQIYGEAFGRDPKFAQFYRNLEAYRASFNKKSDVMGGRFFNMRGRRRILQGHRVGLLLPARSPVRGLLPRLAPGVRRQQMTDAQIGRSSLAVGILPARAKAGLRNSALLPAASVPPGTNTFVRRGRTHRYNPGFNPLSILMTSAWLLPEHIADVLPSEARRIEELRRKLLDLARSYGFELVIPPMLEHLESLLSGTGHALDLKTFKLVDQLSGRMLGVRADTTPQVARIDAHLLNRQGVARLCYCGPVLHARPDRPLATREPLQFGAEIYGHAGLEADLESAGPGARRPGRRGRRRAGAGHGRRAHRAQPPPAMK
jgi:hypothetical protein